MTEFDYPPAREYTLNQALNSVGEGLDADTDRDTENLHDALAWAVNEFGGEATIELQAFTAKTRSRTLDTARRTTVGELGPNQVQDWLTAAGVVNAPWLTDDEDLQKRHELLTALPPALVDWCNAELTDLNDLSEGN